MKHSLDDPFLNSGQKTLEGHSGMTNVPEPRAVFVCPMTLGTKLTGETNQLFSPNQNTEKESVCSEPGYQNLLLKRGSCAF